MAVVLCWCSKYFTLPLFQTARLYQTTVPVAAGKAWRESQGHARTGNEYGPLTDLPDWSFADGRPAPMSRSIRQRQEIQSNIAERVQMLGNEMLTAVQQTKDKKIMKEREKQILESKKLKPKGLKVKPSRR
ncbi:large ribosomal subunit protein mL52-like [Antedon mediterranea]|uniref:large ribosomal subunit protein mL52-like n=1 Tax=Antedon mediterranea TaxID=105859 RepID=UPI003AF56189